MRLRACVLALALCAAARADGPDRELAKTRFKAGQALFQRGRVSEALAEFEDGRRAFALPEFDYNIGMCLAKLDRPAEAADALQRYIDARPDDPEATAIWKMIAELRAQAVKKEAERKAAEQRAAEEKRAAELQPSPKPQPLPAVVPSSSTEDGALHKRKLMTGLAIGGAAIGGAAILVAVFTGVRALGAKSDYDTSCKSGPCDDKQYVSAHRSAQATDALITVGAALVVTSVVLFATRPKLAKRFASGITF